MTATTAGSLVNLLGFVTGIVLYAMLLWMVLSSRQGSNRLLLLTGLLGLAWNIGAFGWYGVSSADLTEPAPLSMAVAFGALCFLPAVVVHSALRAVEKVTRLEHLLIVGSAYIMGAIATIMHFYSTLDGTAAPSQLALRGVAAGFGALLIALLVVTRGQRGRGRALSVVAMSIFAVSALHLSNHEAGNDPWWLQLAGHHASLPLAFLILYQDFRFALADIFLKRALAFILLAGLTFGIFLAGVTPLLVIATALVYPLLRRGAGWFVDNIVLQRADSTDLASRLSQAIDPCQNPAAILDEASRIIAPALSAQSIEWSEATGGEQLVRVRPDRRGATVIVATAEEPGYMISIQDLAGGRRLLSDDIAMLERAVMLIARRIDAVRSMQERYRRDLREQEIRNLAAEAELRALRAQINPHFLFNALTTIGYLIQTAPERALGTLMRLSGLLRGLLKSGQEFVTIGEELDLIEAYLDIERARFEDRLHVHIDVPSELRGVRIPALIIQPLVENAIKHGISECMAGGEVRISAHAADSSVVISVSDTGTGITEAVLDKRRARGHGLTNVEHRLRLYGNSASPLKITSKPGRGTVVEIRVPAEDAHLTFTSANSL
jgi:signal transduction histidine kinase